MTTEARMEPGSDMEQRLRRLEWYVEVLENAFQGLAAVRASEYIDIMALMTLALRHGLTTADEIEDIRRDVTTEYQLHVLLDGPLAARLTVVRELEARLVASRTDGE
jgi:hypothetical protein